jgi:hypothetical protein
MSREELRDQVSQGGLSDFLMYVERASFAVDPQYSEKTGSDVVFLHWEGPTNVEDHPILVKDGFHPKWALDPDFVTVDGRTVQSQSGKKQRVGKAYGRMCKTASDATAEYEGKPNDPLANVTAMQADTWQGHTWLMGNVEYDFKGDIGKITQLDPVQYIGPGDLTKSGVTAVAAPVAPVAAPGPTVAPVAPVAAPAAAPAAPGTGDPLLATVEAMAATAPDFTTFKQAALAVNGVTDRTDLLIAISDATNGVWSRIRPNG